MRILACSWNAYVDPADGASRSLRTLCRWLGQFGHSVHAVTSSSTAGLLRGDIAALLTPFEAHWRNERRDPERGVARCHVDGVDVRVVRTSDSTEGTPADVHAFVERATGLLKEHRPHLVVALGGHRGTHEVLRRAKERGSTTMLAAFQYGMERHFFFQDVDYVLTPCAHLAEHYRAAARMQPHVMSPAVDWIDVIANDGAHDRITVVKPTPSRGAALTAALVKALAERRPDIEWLFVEADERFKALAKVDWSSPRYRFVRATPNPRDFLAQTRILLAPSLSEPFGRTALDATLAGLPVIGANVGGLPEAMLGAGVSLNVPPSLARNMHATPTPEELLPWSDAIIRIWDHDGQRADLCARAQKAASGLVPESAQRVRYENFFSSLRV